MYAVILGTEKRRGYLKKNGVGGMAAARMIVRETSSKRRWCAQKKAFEMIDHFSTGLDLLATALS